MLIFAIDPGNIESGYAVLDVNQGLKPIEKGKIENEELRNIFSSFIAECKFQDKEYRVAVEMIASYGMAVGKTVFDTCVWIGRFMEIAGGPDEVQYIYRKDEKMNLCYSMKAKDGNIKQALVDRFASGEKNYGKGTKKEPGWFFGFKADIWQAYAVGVTYFDMYVGEV